MSARSARTPTPSVPGGSVFARTLARPEMALVLWIFALTRLAPVLLSLPARSHEIDFSHYYASALALREGLNPYVVDLTPLATRLGLHVDEINHATYPPTFFLLFEPLTLMSPESAYWTWTGLNLAFLAVALFILLRREADLDLTLTLSLCALAMWYAPTLVHIYAAQPEFLILLLLVVMMRWLKKEREPAAGLALAAAVLLKIFPAAMAGYLIVRKRWRALEWAAVGIVFGAVVTIAFVGFERSVSFVKILSFLTSPLWLSRTIDVSLQAFVSRLFWGAERAAGGDYGAWMEAARRLAVAAAEFATLVLTARSTSADVSDEDPDNRAFSAWVVASIMLSPTAWVHYMVLLLIPFSMLAASAARGQANRRAIALAVASYLLIPILPALDAWTANRRVLSEIAAEGPTLSLLLAYASACLFASDRETEADDLISANVASVKD